MPVEVKGGRGVPSVYDTVKVLKWYKDRAISDATGDTQQDEAEIDRRTKRAKMLQAELELAKARGEVAYIKDFEQVWAARWAVVRQNVMNVKQRAVLQLLGETDETIFKQKLGDELSLALETAADAQLDLSDNAEDDAE